MNENSNRLEQVVAECAGRFETRQAVRHQLPRPLHCGADATTSSSSRGRSWESEVTQLDVDFVSERGVGEATLGDEVGNDSLSLASQRRVEHVPIHLHRNVMNSVLPFVVRKTDRYARRRRSMVFLVYCHLLLMQ